MTVDIERAWREPVKLRIEWNLDEENLKAAVLKAIKDIQAEHSFLDGVDDPQEIVGITLANIDRINFENALTNAQLTTKVRDGILTIVGPQDEMNTSRFH